jgi:hypothetical protein
LGSKHTQIFVKLEGIIVKCMSALQ